MLAEEETKNESQMKWCDLLREFWVIDEMSQQIKWALLSFI